MYVRRESICLLNILWYLWFFLNVFQDMKMHISTYTEYFWSTSLSPPLTEHLPLLFKSLLKCVFKVIGVYPKSVFVFQILLGLLPFSPLLIIKKTKTKKTFIYFVLVIWSSEVKIGEPFCVMGQLSLALKSVTQCRAYQIGSSEDRKMWALMYSS